jgi:hypothetical protein
MKTTSYILLIAVALLSSACERNLDFEGPKDETANDFVINALAVADGALTVYLNRSYLVNKAPTQYYDYEHAVLWKDDITTDYVSSLYADRTAIINADVRAVVNGQDTYDLVLDTDKFYYTSTEYVPRAGDHIVLTASTSTKRLRAETVVPAKPQIEIVSYEVLPENPYVEVNGLENPTDTIVRLTCRIIDAGGNQFYRLRVRNENMFIQDSGTVYYEGHIPIIYYTYLMQDIYFSEDKLFVDSRLTKNFGGWPARFSNVFDNSLMKNGSYTFTIDSPKAIMNYLYLTGITNNKLPIIPKRVMVELQAVSSDLYQHLKSVQLYRITETDAFSEPVQVFSNAEGGWGIFGALSYDRHYIEYWE